MLFKRIRSHIFLGLFLACTGIVILLTINLLTLRQAESNTNTIKKKQEQLRFAQEILIDLQNMETGQRGYVLTRDSSFLKSYETGFISLKKDTLQFIESRFSSDENKNHVEELMGLVRNKLAHMNQVLSTYQNYGNDSAKDFIAQKSGLQMMDAIRNKMDRFEKTQQSDLTTFSQQISQSADKSVLKLMMMGLLIVLLVSISFYFIRKDYKSINAQNKALSFHSALLENISDAIISTDNEFKLIDWNKEAELMFGLKREEILGKNIFSILNINNTENQADQFMRQLKKGKSWRGELRHLNKNNNIEMSLEFSSSVIVDSKGKSIGTVSVIRDITLQHISQEQLRELSRKLETDIADKIKTLTQTNVDLKEARERFYLIANATNECLWDWDVTTNKIWGNRAYLQLLDKEENEDIDYMEFVQRVDEEDNKRIAELFSEAIQKKEQYFTTSFHFISSDGTVKQFVNKSYILYDENGSPKRCLGGLTDVTIQNKIQKQIIKEKEISDNLINSLPGVFYMFNKNGKYLRWNKNTLKVSGFSEEEIGTMSPLDFVPVDQQPILIEKIESVFKHGFDNLEAEFLTKDGRKIPYYFTGSYIKLDGEDCLMGVGYDMTEKLAYQQQLKDLAAHLETIREEEQIRISREIHDELGQQLTGMKMQLQFMKKAYEKGNETVAEKILDTIQLTDDMIQSVRKISLQLRPTILDDLGLVTAMECLTEDINKKYKIACVFKTNYSKIELDQQTATSFYRIFQESITNIIRHAEASVIEVSLHSDDITLSMTIKDNGKGFDTNKVELGKSIGLIGVKERADMIGASCSVISGEGLGTEIIIRKKLKK